MLKPIKEALEALSELIEAVAPRPTPVPVRVKATRRP